MSGTFWPGRWLGSWAAWRCAPSSSLGGGGPGTEVAFSDRGAPPSPSSLCSAPREVALLLPWRDAGGPAVGMHHALCSTFSPPAVGTGWGVQDKGHPKRMGSLLPFRTLCWGQHFNQKSKGESPQIWKAKRDGGPRGRHLEPETAPRSCGGWRRWGRGKKKVIKVKANLCKGRGSWSL